jgi:glyoxylase-like metal-dependent hydrolase (beta-lactamase superfamily II)
MSTSSNLLPESEHFNLHQLAEGVFAAIATPQGAAYSNAGIIDLGDRTLVFDTLDTPAAARDLRIAAESLTGRMVAYVVISHVHSDHWMGNQVFPSSTIILSTHKIREVMPEWGDELLEHQRDTSDYEDYLGELKQRLKSEKDPRWQTTLKRSIRTTRYQLRSLPELVLRYPDQTFEGNLIFHGSQRWVELRSTGEGHSESDVVLLLPEEGIAFIGDLGFFGTQPFLPYSQLEAWKKHLLFFEGSDYETFVPGHGKLGTKEDLALQRRYFEVLEQQVSAVLQAGGTPEDALKIELPEPFDTWLAGGMGRFEANVNFMVAKLTEET